MRSALKGSVGRSEGAPQVRTVKYVVWEPAYIEHGSVIVDAPSTGAAKRLGAEQLGVMAHQVSATLATGDMVRAHENGT